MKKLLQTNKNKKQMKKTITLLAVVLLFATTIFAQVPPYVPTSGLIGWYPFTGNANDQSGNSLNGNVVGATLTSDRNSIANTSYDFDFATVGFGSQTDDVYVAYSPLLNVTNITVSLWIYPRSYYWGGNPASSAIIHRYEYGYSNPNGQVWGIDMTQNNFYAFVLDACATNSQNHVNNISSMPLTLNVWSNIVFTYDGASLKLYLNSTLINTVSSTLVMNTAGNSGISIGESDQANGYWAPTDGKIDDIGIWNRALTQQEITNLYTLPNDTCHFSVYDTTHLTAYDTTHLTAYDTTHLTAYDTTHLTAYDTTHLTAYDTTHLTAYDTTHLTLYDTTYISVYDTIHINDTSHIAVTDTLIINALLTGIIPPNNTNTIKIFPNPTSDHIFIDTGTNVFMTGYTIEIRNILAQLVYSQVMTASTQYFVDLSGWTGMGTYFVYIKDLSSTVIATKVLVLQ